MNLFQYNLEDGYEHNIQPVSTVTISGDRKLQSVGTDVKILFNQNPTFADKTLIINDSDFEKLSADITGSAGIANLFQFQNWEDSYAGVCEVKEYLQESNQLNEDEQTYYELSSKVEKYQDAKKSGQFLLFLMAFVIGLMIMAEFLLIHSRIQAEKEENSRVVCSLRMLGMIDKEMVKCLCYKNFLRFIPPLVVGTILSFLPSYYLNESYGMGTNGILAGIVFGVILTVGIFVVVRRYSEKEEKLPSVNQTYEGAPYFNVDFIGGFDLIVNDQTVNPDFYINYPPYNQPGVLWCNLTGHSMEPEISNGDIIALREVTTPIQYLPAGEIYGIVTEEYRTVKRIRLSQKEGFVRLIPSNKSEEFCEQEIPISMIIKIYAVLGSIRKFF